MKNIDELLKEINSIDADGYYDQSEPLNEKEKENILSIALEKIKLEKQAPAISIRKWSKFAKAAVFVLFAMSVMGGVAVASEVFEWSPYVVEYFGLDENRQEELSESASSINKSVTNNGITVEIIQTIAEKNLIYIIYSVTVPDDFELQPENYSIDKMLLSYADTQKPIFEEEYISGEDNFKYEGNKRTFIRSFSLFETEIREAPVCLTFSGISGFKAPEFKKASIPGEWKFDWNLKVDDVSKTYDMNQKIQIGEFDFTVDSISISPLSLEVKVNAPDGLSNSDLGDDNSIYRLKEIISQDGTLMDFIGLSGQVVECADFSWKAKFSTIIEPENVKSIWIGDNEIEIPQK